MIVNLLKPESLQIEDAVVYVRGLPAWLGEKLRKDCVARALGGVALPENLSDLAGEGGEKLAAALSAEQMQALSDVTTGMALDFARYGIQGWEGITADGAPLAPEFETVNVSGVLVSRLTAESMLLSLEHFLIVGQRVQELSKLSQAAKKNSGAPSAPAASRAKSGSPRKR